jgi:hypothetical protein
MSDEKNMASKHFPSTRDVAPAPKRARGQFPFIKQPLLPLKMPSMVRIYSPLKKRDMFTLA